jgi:hypothetical protein
VATSSRRCARPVHTSFSRLNIREPGAGRLTRDEVCPSGADGAPGCAKVGSIAGLGIQRALYRLAPSMPSVVAAHSASAMRSRSGPAAVPARLPDRQPEAGSASALLRRQCPPSWSPRGVGAVQQEKPTRARPPLSGPLPRRPASSASRRRHMVHGSAGRALWTGVPALLSGRLAMGPHPCCGIHSCPRVSVSSGRC